MHQSGRCDRFGAGLVPRAGDPVARIRSTGHLRDRTPKPNLGFGLPTLRGSGEHGGSAFADVPNGAARQPTARRDSPGDLAAEMICAWPPLDCSGGPLG